MQDDFPSLSSSMEHWRNSIAPSDYKFDPAEHDIELQPLQQHYTSLRDLMAVSPTKRGSTRGHEVEWCDMSDLKFKDKLLKLAARAYLQPMGRASTPESHIIAQCWITFSARNKALVYGLIQYIEKQVDTCIKFFQAQAFNLMQLFRPSSNWTLKESC
ncbi:hypothetical protein KP509_31G059200 [Ceratopteris richardii]|nr:hypothetical protein KP509_31G059200 [Ceratopteris richardii]